MYARIDTTTKAVKGKHRNEVFDTPVGQRLIPITQAEWDADSKVQKANAANDALVEDVDAAKVQGLAAVRIATGEQITVTGDWSIERQTNCIDGVYPNVVRPSDSKTFVFAAECKKYRVAIIQQGNVYEDVVSAALTVADVTAAVAAIAFDTSLILTYSEVKGQVNG